MSQTRRYLNRPLVCTGEFNGSNFSQPSVQGIRDNTYEKINGLRYIVGNDPTGRFSNANKNQVATYFSKIGAWVFEDPYDGMEVINTETNRLLKYDGEKWQSILTFSFDGDMFPIPVHLGGTGATTSKSARENLETPALISICNKPLSKNSYYVIPLFPLTRSIPGLGLYACSGKVIFSNENEGGIDKNLYVVDINASSILPELVEPNIPNVPIWSMSVTGVDPSIISAVTYQYNLIQYFGLQFMWQEANATIDSIRFMGFTNSENHFDIIKYHDLTTGERINEIRTSIISLTSKNSKQNSTVFYGSISGEKIVATDYLGPLKLDNFPQEHMKEDKVLAVISDDEGGLKLEWCTANGGITHPGEDPEPPTEYLLDGGDSYTLKQLPSNFKIYDLGDSEDLINAPNIIIYDGKNSSQIPTD